MNIGSDAKIARLGEECSAVIIDCDVILSGLGWSWLGEVDDACDQIVGIEKA